MDEETQKYITPEIDKRKYRRAKLVTQIRCEALGREDLLLTRDVSLGGLFVHAKNPFPLQAEVSLSFRLEPTDPPISCRGTVVHSIRGMGMGIQFLELSEEALQFLQKFVDEVS